MAQRLPPQSNVSASVRTAIVVVGVLLLALPGTAQRRETDVDTDLRRFYEAAGDRGVWIDARGRPTLDAQRVLARLRDVAEDSCRAR